MQVQLEVLALRRAVAAVVLRRVHVQVGLQDYIVCEAISPQIFPKIRLKNDFPRPAAVPEPLSSWRGPQTALLKAPPVAAIALAREGPMALRVRDY